ncbi:hypothetical protein GGR54DRAFT_339975 [Hypoxylon sp. NC1633]|nr:hypothetical protein GGR54DRAFT_339975 [Hypoxylon sp. NC1633]
MSLTFHPFLRLPRELRDRIWDMAIRPDQPGAHFFSIVADFDPDNESSERAQEHLMEINEKTVLNQLLYLKVGAPGFSSSDPNEVSWTIDNPSQYLFDSGLWTACKDSRDRIQRKFDRFYTIKGSANNPFWSPPDWYPISFEDVSATGCFRSEAGLQHFNVCPHKDLICLQLRGWTKEPMYNSWSSLFCQIRGQIPFLDSKWDFLGPFNLALEFNPEWCGFNTRAKREFADIIYSLDLDGDTLWLIDYRIRRRGHHIISWSSETCMREEDFERERTGGRFGHRQVFHATDRVFVEVRGPEDVWYVTDSSTAFDTTEGNEESSVWSFAGAVNETIRSGSYLGVGFDPDDDGDGFPRVRVLMCEQL